jgi:hypothetical protein
VGRKIGLERVKPYLNSSTSPKFEFEDGKQNILTSLSSTSS